MMALALAASGSMVAVAPAPLPIGLNDHGHPQAVAGLPIGPFGFVRLRNGVQLRVNGVVKTVLFYGPATVRVNSNDGRNYWTAKSIVVTGSPAETPLP
ncbi:hypothetical protein ACVOMT_17795 [Sphingomonas panni]